MALLGSAHLTSGSWMGIPAAGTLPSATGESARQPTSSVRRSLDEVRVMDCRRRVGCRVGNAKTWKGSIEVGNPGGPTYVHKQKGTGGTEEREEACWVSVCWCVAAVQGSRGCV